MNITHDTIPKAIEMLLKEIQELRSIVSKQSDEQESKMIDRLEARRLLGTHGRLLSEAKFAELKNEGKISTYGFGGKHFYKVEELQNLKKN